MLTALKADFKAVITQGYLFLVFGSEHLALVLAKFVLQVHCAMLQFSALKVVYVQGLKRGGGQS